MSHHEWPLDIWVELLYGPTHPKGDSVVPSFGLHSSLRQSGAHLSPLRGRRWGTRCQVVRSDVGHPITWWCDQMWATRPSYVQGKIVCMLRRRGVKAAALKGAAIVGMAMVGRAVGAMAVGEMAIGALAIGALRINALSMRTGRIEELSIGKLTVDELVIKKREEEG